MLEGLSYTAHDPSNGRVFCFIKVEITEIKSYENMDMLLIIEIVFTSLISLFVVFIAVFSFFIEKNDKKAREKRHKDIENALK